MTGNSFFARRRIFRRIRLIRVFVCAICDKHLERHARAFVADGIAAPVPEAEFLDIGAFFLARGDRDVD